MFRAISLIAAACGLAACQSIPQRAEPLAKAGHTASNFVGVYDGSSFETAMGMQIFEGGTFRWALAVGALDLRAAGTWRRDGEELVFQSDPVPVPPEFRVLGIRDLPDAPMVKVELPDGQAFEWASLQLHCRVGEDSFHQVYAEGWSPEIERRMNTDPDGTVYDAGPVCTDPLAISISQSNYKVRTGRLELAELGWAPGRTIVVEFRPNDLGVQDFSGVRGRRRGDRLVIETDLGPLEMRKIVPSDRPSPD